MPRHATTLVDTAEPSISPFGILSSAADVVEDSSNHWEGGFTYETADGQVSAENTTVLGSTAHNTVEVVANPEGDAFKFYYPFSVRTAALSSTFATKPSDLESTAKKALDIITQKAIEFEFWDGGVAKLLESENDNRYLAHSSAVDVTPTPGTAVKPRYGLALLESALGNATIGSAGVIHAPRVAASVLAPSLCKDGDGLKTDLGNGLVAGTGYTRRGPNGVLATGNLVWLYATGPVTVRLGATKIIPEKLNQAVDISQNNIAYYADRPAAVTWSTSNLYAVLVDLSLDYA